MCAARHTKGEIKMRFLNTNNGNYIDAEEVQNQKLNISIKNRKAEARHASEIIECN